MVAYEVQTEDLIGIRDQLAAQANLVGSTSSGVAEATTTLLQQMEVGLTQAQTTIDGLLQDLAGTVQTAGTAAAAADWLGPDSDAFRQANVDLIAAIARSQTQLQTVITGHRTATTQIGATLLGTLQQFTADANRSQELTSQLSEVVGAEADSYEQAFNGSWSGGGTTAVSPAAMNGNGLTSAPSRTPSPTPNAPPVPPPPRPPEPESDEGISWSDLGHTFLDFTGLVPGLGEPADGLNAAWYAAEGDYINAGLSAGAMVPGWGWAAAAAKFGRKGVKAGKAGDEVVDGADTASDVSRTGENVDDTAAAGGKSSDASNSAGRPPDVFVDNLVRDPVSVAGRDADDIARQFNDAGYSARVESGTKKETSGKAVQVRVEGHPEVTNVQVHPGGGRHTSDGVPYWKISTQTTGTIWVAPRSFRGADELKGKVVYYD